MSENKERTLDDVKREYSQFCFDAGQIQYQIFSLKKDLELLNNQIRDLNFEAAQIKEKEGHNA